ncbi:hypothetical protein [Billgrantia kenyensis]|uniref:RiboL-PSP-HEPN domain-containing protein n=1 Tax=Billgrantia kenyensis TaxID=321266 RepID=A0A7W0AG52_9GAMM|nr:hypothetical protein [Halomonas kenyensis]MBA2781254.1 hypothetical protein [Halomonas kenyensis]MCG6663926.1 hypothetical protein [Halomonas kenyensis]
MKSNFFLQTRKQHWLEEIDLTSLPSDSLKSVFETYVANMNEVLCVVQSSFNLILHAQLEKQANQVFQKNLLLAHANALRGGYHEDSDRIAHEAQKLTKEELDAKEDTEILNCVVETLNELEKDEAIATSNFSTLRQSIVILWSATESLVRDVVRTILNQDKDLAIAFFESSMTSPYWNKKNISYEHFKEHEFNLSERLGDVALEINACSNSASMGSAYAFLLGSDSETCKAIKSRDFFYLCRLRNIIAHKNGIVDKKFKDETQCVEPIGDRFKVSPEVFDFCFDISKSLAKYLIKEISSNNMHATST